MSSSLAISSRVALSVPLWAREFAELPRNQIVARATCGLFLELGHLDYQDCLRLVESGAGQLLLHGFRLGVADLEVGIGGSGQDVGHACQEARLVGRHRFEPGDDVTDGLGLGRERGRFRDVSTT